MPRKSEGLPAADAELISIKEVTARYHISRDTIRRRIADGSITAYRQGPKLIRIDRAEMERGLFHQLPTTGNDQQAG
jgi:excisionase family DNA binding protein